MHTSALRLIALGLALGVGGCVLWRGDDLAAPGVSAAPIERAENIALAPPPPPSRARIAAAPTHTAEDFTCADGTHVRLTYSPARDEARVSINAAPVVALQRGEANAYRLDALALRRAGPRLVLTSAEATVHVRGGDTLGAIALRHYGDRHYAAVIAAANADQVPDPNLIYPGQTLRLPAAERRCRRAGHLQAAYDVRPTGDYALERRAFSPPSDRQPEQRRIRATSLDP